MRTVRQLLKEIRTNKKLSYKTIADKAGYSKEYITLIEGLSSKPLPNYSTLLRIANAMEMTREEKIEMLCALEEETGLKSIMDKISKINISEEVKTKKKIPDEKWIDRLTKTLSTLRDDEIKYIVKTLEKYVQKKNQSIAVNN